MSYTTLTRRILITLILLWKRGTVEVKCLAQEHSAMSPVKARTQTPQSGVRRADHYTSVVTMGKRFSEQSLVKIFYGRLQIHKAYRGKVVC